MATRFPSLAEVLDLYCRVLLVGGGASAIRDLGALESALAQPRATFADEDLAMTPRAPGGPHVVAVTYRTGALVTEIKFTVNGEFELATEDNRIVRMVPTTQGGDTTVYRAKDNSR